MHPKFFSLLAFTVAVFASTSALALDLNSFRAANGLKPLRVNARFASAANAHAKDMAQRGSMDHNGFQERMGKIARTAAENVAWGCETQDCVFQMWAGSYGHRANMLRTDITGYGLASAKGANGQRYWTLELGN